MAGAIPPLPTNRLRTGPEESPRKDDQRRQRIHDDDNDNNNNRDRGIYGNRRTDHVYDIRRDDYNRDIGRNNNYSLINLAKLYTDEQKYSGDNDTFDYKFNIFLDLCERTDVPPDIHIKAFPTMLKGAALNYYYTSCKSNPKITILDDLCENIRSYFEGLAHERNMLLKWNAISLRNIITKNPGKSIEESLQILIQELRNTQHGLGKDLRQESFFFNKVLTACQDHPACSLACVRPVMTVTGLINDLRSSIVIYEKTKNYD